MTWADVLCGRSRLGDPLAHVVDSLLEQARTGWPLWRAGHDALHAVRLKTLVDRGQQILVQTNPGRTRSVHAAVDPASIAARPCFLCPENLPHEERGIGWQDLVLLPNPHPIMERHLTIPAREHQPQALRGRGADLVLLAQDLGEAMVALYNGPRCGASAPDHFHFQACAATLPAFGLVASGPQLRRHHAVSGFGRSFVALIDPDAARLGERIEAAIAAWGNVHPGEGEPMCNVIARWREGCGTALFFPRRAHRPAAFHASGERHIGVSPAAIEMAGILVVTDAASFNRLDAAAARAIYEEVSPTPREFAAFLERIS